MRLVVALAFALAGCGSSGEELSEAHLTNRAETLERAANATTDQLIREIQAAEEAEAPAN